MPAALLARARAALLVRVREVLLGHLARQAHGPVAHRTSQGAAGVEAAAFLAAAGAAVR